MKAYCYMCGKDVDVVPTERECTTEFKHEQVYYVEQVCLCPHCGEELYVGSFTIGISMPFTMLTEREKD